MRAPTLLVLAVVLLGALAQPRVQEFADGTTCPDACGVCFDRWSCPSYDACAAGRQRLSAEQLALAIVSNGLEYEAGSALLECNALQVGVLSDAGDAYERGVVLSTGLVRQLVCAGRQSGGPNATAVPVGVPGDASLDLVLQELRGDINAFRASRGLPDWTASDVATQAPTLGRCALSFRVRVLAGSTLSFPFALGSEEYPLDKSANDVFAVHVTDVDGTGDTRNVARVPTTNEPANAVSVNADIAPDFYDDALASANVFRRGSVFDGNAATRPMMARAAVERGRVYALRLSLASAADRMLDSAVYWGPLRTDLALRMTTELNGNLVVGCSNATIVVSVDLPYPLPTAVRIRVVTQSTWSTADYFLDPAPIARLGDDYLYEMPANTTRLVVTLVPIDDGSGVAAEPLRVCMGTFCQSATVYRRLTITEAFASPAVACPDVAGAQSVTLVATCPVCDAVGAQLFWTGNGLSTVPAIGSSVTATPALGNNAYIVQARAPPLAPTCVRGATVNVTGIAGTACTQGTTRATTSATSTTTTTARSTTATSTSSGATTTTTTTTTTTSTPTAPVGGCDNLPQQQPCLVQLLNFQPAVCVNRVAQWSIATFAAPNVPAACGALDCGSRSWSANVTWFTSYGVPVGATVLYPVACTGAGNYTFRFVPTYIGLHSVELLYGGVPVRASCACPQLAPLAGLLASDCNRCAHPGSDVCIGVNAIGNRVLRPDEYFIARDGSVVLLADADAAQNNVPGATRIVWNWGADDSQ